MRTEDQADFAGTEPTGDFPNASEQPQPVEPSAAHVRAVLLAQEHGDLDNAIAFLTEACIPDAALVARLKKRKLHLRDEIVRIEQSCSLATPLSPLQRN